MFKKIAVVLFLGSSLMFLGCQKKSDANSTYAPSLLIFNQDSSVMEQTLKDNLVKAKEAAKIWQANAEFVGIVLKISSTSTSDTLTNTFVFGSPNDQNGWWTYSVVPQTGQVVRSLTPKDDFLGKNLLPIQESYWQTNYIDALKTAENSGGADFRAQNNETQITLALLQTEPNNWLWWKINYLSGSQNKEIIVSAKNGEVQ